MTASRTTSTTTRRHFLAAAAALPVAMRTLAQGPAAQGASPQWVLLGTDKGKGIYRARWNAANGELGTVELAIETERPTFFALHPTQPVLYAANEAAKGDGGLTVFGLGAGASLTAAHRFSSHGGGPCYVSTNGQRTYVADYTAGALAAYAVRPDGSLHDDIGSFNCNDSLGDCGALGPVHTRQEAPHLHCAVIAPHSGHVLACDLGDDKILLFAPARQGLMAPRRIPARKGSGPRHLALHPNGRWVYCIHELDCTIDLYDGGVHGKTPELRLREESVISTLPRGTAIGENTGAEILVSRDGQFVYASTRGINQLTAYRVDSASGLLTGIQRLSCGGDMPRLIALDPTERWLLSCNQGAPGNISVFARNPDSGLLAEQPKTFAADTPMCVAWV